MPLPPEVCPNWDKGNIDNEEGQNKHKRMDVHREGWMHTEDGRSEQKLATENKGWPEHTKTKKSHSHGEREWLW